MRNNKSIQAEIVTILREIGSKKCLAKAKILEQEISSNRALHLRDLALNSSNIASIVSCFKQEEAGNGQLIKSISFSYNPLLGDSGAIVLMKYLPKSICEIGLVDCGISDIGGIEILNWMSHAPNLQMICMEQNKFSEKLSVEFKKFKTTHPDVLVIY